jgi:hypothetical protein
VRLGSIADGLFAVRAAIASLEEAIREQRPRQPTPRNEWVE